MQPVMNGFVFDGPTLLGYNAGETFAYSEAQLRRPSFVQWIADSSVTRIGAAIYVPPLARSSAPGRPTRTRDEQEYLALPRARRKRPTRGVQGEGADDLRRRHRVFVHRTRLLAESGHLSCWRRRRQEKKAGVLTPATTMGTSLLRRMENCP